MIRRTPFKSIGGAIAFYNTKNPARQRYVNFFEPDRTPHSQPDHDPADLWASIALALAQALEQQSARKKMAWIWRNIGDRDGQLHPAEIAKRLHIRKRQVYNYLRQVDDDVLKSLIKYGLIQD